MTFDQINIILFAIILNFPLAIGISLFFCGWLLDRSNNMGDTEGKYREFGNNDFRIK